MEQAAYIRDHFATTVEPRILEQYRDSARWKACLKAVVDKLQLSEDAAVELSHAFDFESEPLAGERLDWIAGLVNVKRIGEEDDASLYGRFIDALGDNTAGTPDSVLKKTAMLSGDLSPQYLEEAPATFFVYTPGGKQIPRRDLKKIAPAGVLALPGAVILTGTGAKLVDAKGRVILAVGHEDRRPITNYLVDDEGNHLIDDQGNRAIVVQYF